jgi:hypothetical protein
LLNNIDLEESECFLEIGNQNHIVAIQVSPVIWLRSIRAIGPFFFEDKYNHTLGELMGDNEGNPYDKSKRRHKL